MPTELYEEWRKSHEVSKGDWHPSYQEYWIEDAPMTDGTRVFRTSGNACAAIRSFDTAVITEPQIAAYLDGLNATLWGRAWDLSQPESREGAKRWLMGVLTALGVEVVE